jgi:hypothetical protein
MGRCCLVGIMLAVVGMFGTAPPSDGPAGTWKVRISFGEGGGGGRVSILKLHLEGNKLSGVMLDTQGPVTAIENVSYLDGRISFEVPRVVNGQRFTTLYSGTLANDTIKGTTQSQRRGSSRTLNWEATRTTPQEISPDVGLPPVAADIDLTDVNYTVWRDHILPDPSELEWEQIPWLTTFKDGILAANAARKPLLLWTMNGHPLGCT